MQLNSSKKRFIHWNLHGSFKYTCVLSESNYKNIKYLLKKKIPFLLQLLLGT